MTYLLCKSGEQIIFPKTQRARKQKASAGLLSYLEHGRKWGQRQAERLIVHVAVLGSMQEYQDQSEKKNQVDQ